MANPFQSQKLDTGNAMFWRNPRLPEYDDLTKIEVNSFRKTELLLWDYVQVKTLLNFSKLPTEDALRTIYAMDPLISCIDMLG